MEKDATQSTAADDLRRWLGDTALPEGSPDDTDDDGGTVARRRRRRAQALAAITIPWLVILLAVLYDGTAPQDLAGPAPEPTPSHVAVEAPRDTPSASDTRTPGTDEPPAAGPLAVGLVRDAVTQVVGDTTTALDTAAAEPGRRLADATWVVRVHAVVLRGDRRRWRSARHEIWAVPVADRNGVVVALDRPWRVRSGDPPTADVKWEPADADIGGVRGALRRAGLPAPPDIDVERHPSLSGVLRATAPARSGGGHVWLRSTPSPAVLGRNPAAAERP